MIKQNKINNLKNEIEKTLSQALHYYARGTSWLYLGELIPSAPKNEAAVIHVSDLDSMKTGGRRARKAFAKYKKLKKELRELEVEK